MSDNTPELPASSGTGATPVSDVRRLLIAGAAIGALIVGVVATRAESSVPNIQLGVGSSESGAALSASSSLRIRGGYVFTLEDGVEIPGSKQDVWKWETPTASDAQDLAQVLGVTDKVQSGGDYGAVFQAGNLTVMENGGWSYYNGFGSTATTSCIMPVDPSEDSPMVSDSGDAVCVSDAPPAAVDLPSDESARTKSFEILGEGFRVNDVTRSEWNVTVSGTYIVEGESTGYWGSVTFADHGSVSSAGGVIGRPSYVGKYRTVSASEALPRLASGMFMAYGGARGAPDVAIGTAVSCPQDVACDTPVPADTLPGCDTSDCAMPDLCSEVDSCQTTVVLTGVRRSITLLYDSSSTVWVVPAYEFVDADGGVWTAMALDDSYLEKAGVTTGPGDVVTPVDPMPAPYPGEAGEGVSEPSPVFDTSSVVGLSESDSVKLIESSGFSARVVARDGEIFATTKDYRIDRVNISIEKDVVVSADIG